jgi:hypothetical protein
MAHCPKCGQNFNQHGRYVDEQRFDLGKLPNSMVCSACGRWRRPAKIPQQWGGAQPKWKRPNPWKML